MQHVGSKLRQKGRPRKRWKPANNGETSTENVTTSSTQTINTSEWKSEDTFYGTIYHGPSGEVLLPAGVFEEMEMFLGK